MALRAPLHPMHHKFASGIFSSTHSSNHLVDHCLRRLATSVRALNRDEQTFLARSRSCFANRRLRLIQNSAIEDNIVSNRIRIEES